MQKIPHDLMRPERWPQIDMSTGVKIPNEHFEPLRLRGGSDDPKPDRSLDVAFDLSATKQLLDAIGPGGDDGNTVSIQSDNRKADSLSDSKSDLNNNSNQEKNGALDVTKQLEKWNKVRESLYSQYGWSSENVNQNSKWDVDMTTTPTEGCQNRDKSVITGTNQWSNEFAKGPPTELAITFADLAQAEGWSEPERWTTNEPEVDREEHPPVASFGGAIPRDFRTHADDAQMPSNSQFANTFSQLRGMDNANDWNKPMPPSNQNQNQSRFPRPITKKSGTTPTSPLDGGLALPHPNDQQPPNSFTAHFQQMNLQDNIMHPYQQRFNAQSQPQNHIAQMSPFDYGQNDSFAQNGREPSQYPWHMQFERNTMMPLPNQTLNQSFLAMDSTLAQNELHGASNSRWPTADMPTVGDASSLGEHFAMRGAIDLVDPSTSTNFIPTATAPPAKNPQTIPNWQHSSFYQNYW